MAIQAENHENMEPNLNNDGLLPSAMALKDSLNQKPNTSLSNCWKVRGAFENAITLLVSNPSGKIRSSKKRPELSNSYLEPMMLTAYQQELLRQLENEIDEYLAK